MSDTLTLLSPAKLNLFLHITGQRGDGYHELQTLFQLLDWGDRLQFESDNSGEISLHGADLGIPAEQNLIVKAAQALPRNTSKQGVSIHLEKRIPEGGGLGGGSSNAATTLLAMNYLWNLRLGDKALQKIGAKLGADVPVFVAGHTAWAEGIGEFLTPVELPETWYLVIAPGCHVSTAEIFSNEQLTRNTSPIKMAAFFEGNSRNDCQQLVRNLHKEVDNALNWLDNFGTAKLTGTGACVFASFDDKQSATSALSQLPESMSGFVARGINTSPVLNALVGPKV
ncbi:4-(cytidine 5'-diphospho)-2-C-methyl-D-erythritol kinase [Halieaceae bacterium IMCC8485]|jgi:4-diphosphocytidyl-2-C-methyl-D-erythritol kinase|uniref:4-diphosphocytidyl-2-C-methyl-D-erythritol kinase n=1 Tax=Candidatus Seongchinamella marina TaxID=2518990 RepID=A0ABT3T0G0_9GAMM|nr:4-(cytidine 5'-diphospho)-2-C-methyl-D-erythritol kinase [Candidatus Seongchinamella marina]MCX2975029.1 4-(cytidine 5'-diphospho)-2-C-methyl-D-erythritol kinase [Candidatus Seongchinamella marina]